MAQFVAFHPNVEVNGNTVLAVVNGMSDYKSLALEKMARLGALQTLKKNGIDDPQPDQWYSQQLWLNSFKQISDKIGPNTLFLIGKTIPAQADWPPHIDDIVKGYGSIDVAYHLNHKLDGQVMFNMETGEMTEGIGHYTFEQTGEREGRMICNNPYPCDFDRGIIEAIGRKFEPTAKVTLDPSQPGRRDGGDTSVYLLTW